MFDSSSRMKRERKTIAAMIRIYCHAHHDVIDGLCKHCQGLLADAEARLDKCPFRAQKPTCANCPVHCYKPEMRERVRRVMRYAGPRMLWRHPILALFHWVDGVRKAPSREK